MIIMSGVVGVVRGEERRDRWCSHGNVWHLVLPVEMPQAGEQHRRRTGELIHRLGHDAIGRKVLPELTANEAHANKTLECVLRGQTQKVKSGFELWYFYTRHTRPGLGAGLEGSL